MAIASDPLNNSFAKRVGLVLRQDPRARDNDAILVIHLLQQLDLGLNAEQIQKLVDFDFERVVKVRELFQKEGKYLPYAPIAKRRKLKAWVDVPNVELLRAREIEKALQIDAGTTSVVAIDPPDWENENVRAKGLV